MREGIEKEVRDLLDASKASGIGIRGFSPGPHRIAFLIYDEPTRVTFAGSIGSSFTSSQPKPTRKLIQEMLDELFSYQQELSESSEVWRDYMRSRSFVVELWIFAGHYDVLIATLEDGKTRFDHPLDE
jgi:hypothetical protein